MWQSHYSPWLKLSNREQQKAMPKSKGQTRVLGALFWAGWTVRGKSDKRRKQKQGPSSWHCKQDLHTLKRGHIFQNLSQSLLTSLPRMSANFERLSGGASSKDSSRAGPVRRPIGYWQATQGAKDHTGEPHATAICLEPRRGKRPWGLGKQIIIQSKLRSCKDKKLSRVKVEWKKIETGEQNESASNKIGRVSE